MSKISLICCILLAVTLAQSQDLTATTDDKREVILRKSGIWFFVERTELENCRATLQDGRRVLLKSNGSWTFLEKTEPTLSNQGGVSGEEAPGRASTDNPGRYHSQKFYYSIRFPDGWMTKRLSDAIVHCKAPGGDAHGLPAYVEVKVTDPKEARNVDEYSQLYAEKSRETLEGYQELDQGKISLAGTNARWLVVAGNLRGITIKFKVYMMVRGLYGYEITYYAQTDDFPAYVNSFEDIVQSFEFE